VSADEAMISDGEKDKRASRTSRRDPLVGWDDLPGDLHREILRLVPLSDATAARAVSREMRDEVDEVWRAWGIRATKGGGRNAICERLHDRRKMTELDFGPLVVHA